MGGGSLYLLSIYILHHETLTKQAILKSSWWAVGLIDFYSQVNNLCSNHLISLVPVTKMMMMIRKSLLLLIIF